MALGWLGWGPSLVGLLGGFVVGAVVGVVLMLTGRAGRRARVPHGPFMIAGAVLGMFAGDALCTLNPVKGTRGPQLMPSGMNTSDAEAVESLAAVARSGAQIVLVGHGEPWSTGAAAAVERARAALR